MISVFFVTFLKISSEKKKKSKKIFGGCDIQQHSFINCLEINILENLFVSLIFSSQYQYQSGCDG